ncbi:hypothetical protein DdX_12017 [Ditylenchus destructor]|uniref:Uncharacterized protein n=1 Tax=Ditylenchus destructor TaxID=166010 RepID=A0AAD4R409_9BILA|nr:hypothetical protein DdX_12017 [Ditylenchus destructor]
MATIFQMNAEELTSLLAFLRPNILSQPKTKDINLSDNVRLRMLITEWLLLNGLSTMHKFERDFDYVDSTEVSNVPPPSGYLSISGRSKNKRGNSGELTQCESERTKHKWKMPSKIDCISCGKYKVGKSSSTNSSKSNTAHVITKEPYSIPNFNEIIFDNIGIDDNDKVFYCSSPYDKLTPKLMTRCGNLNEVKYFNSHTNGISSKSNGTSRTQSQRNADRKSGSFLSILCLGSSAQDLDQDQKKSLSVHSQPTAPQVTTTVGSNYKIESHQIRRPMNGGIRPLEVEHKDKCADMCLTCLFCECKANTARLANGVK